MAIEGIIKNIFSSFDEISILIQDIQSLSECLYTTLETKIFDGKDCSFVLPLAEIFKNKTEKAQNEFNSTYDELYKYYASKN